MSIATSPSKSFSFIAAITLITGLGFCAGGVGNAAAQSMPDAEKGRYALSPVADGVVRLDTRTGAVSTCSNAGAGWACYSVPDERAALDAEIGRLQADSEKSRTELEKSKIELEKSKTELEKLKTELAAREPAVNGKIDEALPKTDQLKKSEPKVAERERRIEIPLPSDRDMDRVMSFLEQAWRRLVEMANRMQKDVSGKI
jgi:septal ring factor EnvC (AmiA/AmiB activator)